MVQKLFQSCKLYTIIYLLFIRTIVRVRERLSEERDEREREREREREGGREPSELAKREVDSLIRLPLNRLPLSYLLYKQHFFVSGLPSQSKNRYRADV